MILEHYIIKGKLIFLFVHSIERLDWNLHVLTLLHYFQTFSAYWINYCAPFARYRKTFNEINSALLAVDLHRLSGVAAYRILGIDNSPSIFLKHKNTLGLTPQTIPHISK